MSTLSPSSLSAILGLSRERVPLGVQARGLGLRRYDVKAAALEFFKRGLIGELPSDDIRAGRTFTWPEVTLPDAPDFEPEAPVDDGEVAPAEVIPAAALPKLWNGKPLSERRLIAVEALAPVPPSARVLSSFIGEQLVALGYRGDRKSVRVLMSGLRNLGFVITYDIVAGGYWMDSATRAKWNGGGNA